MTIAPITRLMNATMKRKSFGIEAIDRLLNGGLTPGALTVIAGATGVGKTQLGLRWAHRGLAEDGRGGLICDLTSRGDSQNHAAYAQRQFGWKLAEFQATDRLESDRVWEFNGDLGDCFRPFAKAARRVTRGDLDPEAWDAWRSDTARVSRSAAAFFYANFVRGSRRVVFDGVEPTSRFGDSIQFDFFEYLYHHVIQQEHDWAAREVFRERYRENEPRVTASPYEHSDISCLYLYTTPEVMLDDLIAKPLGDGDVFSNANTVILMGRTRDGGGLGRSLVVVKHRGSACGDEILPYRIGGGGIEPV